VINVIVSYLLILSW